MALRREPEKHANHERWLVSYGDLLTLLFAVFVVMYAMSQSDKKKVEEVAASMRESFGYTARGGAGGKPVVIDSGAVGIVPDLKSQALTVVRERTPGGKIRHHAAQTDYSAIKSSIDAYLVKSGNSAKVSVEITRRGVLVSLKEAGFFDSGSARLKKESIQTLTAIAETLNQYANTFRVEGHTDNIPINTGEFRSNWELSTARAANVVHFLTGSAGFDPEGISVVGYGEYQPTGENSTQEGRAKNRRVDIVLLSDEAATGEAKAAINTAKN